jgi:hypothetical protein
MPTRKQFCQSCLAMVLAGLNCRRPLGGLAGLGVPLVFGRKGDEVKKTEDDQKKNRIVGACGITCSACPVYIATRTNDDALRAKTAREWSAMFHADIKAENINCDGCPSDGPRLFHHCTECEIRKCAREKKLANCAQCPEYSCQKLDAFLAQVPEARETLDELRIK